MWEAIKLTGWGALFVLMAINTWLTHERIEGQRELNGNVVAFRKVVEAFAD